MKKFQLALCPDTKKATLKRKVTYGSQRGFSTASGLSNLLTSTGNRKLDLSYRPEFLT